MRRGLHTGDGANYQLRVMEIEVDIHLLTTDFWDSTVRYVVRFPRC